MNVSCPECQTVFRVDPARVPGPGVRARCSVCGGIIPITAARSWTDDFATRHDAASLTAAARPAAPVDAARSSSPTLGARPVVANSGPRVTPPAGSPRSATPARIPPFAPGRRPTPPAGSTAPASVPTPQASGAEPRGVPPVTATNAAPTSPTMGVRAPAPMPVRSPSRPETDVPRQPAAPPGGPAGVSDAPFGLPARPSAPAASSQPVSAPPPSPRPAAASDSASGGARRDVTAPTPSKAPINPFLANDPNQKAKRLARALVSDMVAYHPQKRDEGMRAGTLKQLFREEIKKSYEEYVDQIGKEFAESTSHFQDALNDVLAGGKKVF